MMDTVVRQLMVEFCASRGLSGLPESEQFEVFATHCVLSEHTFDQFAAENFRIGGSADGGIDGFAVVVNERLFRAADALEAFMTSLVEVSPTIVFVQAKSSPKMDRKFIADLRVRVGNILRTNLALDNASDVEPLRDCIRVLRRHMDRLSRKGVRLAVVYANTAIAANDEMRREAQHAAEALADSDLVGEATFECLGRDDLARRYERSMWSATARMTFTEHFSIPADAGVTQARQGVVPAAELVQALSDEDGRLNSMLFSENIREYQPEAQVNDEIRQTLRDESRRRRFAVLNNGVTIVARSLRGWSGPEVVLRDFQVVNGCQTCHVLAEERGRLDGVAVKVQILECGDDDIINEIVTATNRQTAIPKSYFVNRQRLLRRLEVHYRHRRAEGSPLHFERRPGRGSNDLRNGVISMNRQLLAHVAMFGRIPPCSDHRDLGDGFEKLFQRATEEEFHIAAAALYRWNWLVDTKRVAKRYRPLVYQAISVVGLRHGVRPSSGTEKQRKARLETISKVVWSDGQWEQLGLHIQSILDDALRVMSITDTKNAAGSVNFGRKVVELARLPWPPGDG